MKPSKPANPLTIFPEVKLRDDRPEDIVTTIDEGAWIYTKDRYGDWRGTNRTAGIRTRLKGGLDWAKHDAAIGRVQRRKGDEWIDDIRY